MNKEYRKLIKHSSVYILSDILNKSVPFFLLPLLTYYLTPSGYGILSNFNVFLSILLIIIGFSSHGVLGIKFYTWPKHRISQLVGNILILLSISYLTLLILILVMSDYIVEATGLSTRWQLLTLTSAFFQFNGILLLNIWRLEEKPFKLMFFEISQTLLNLGLTGVLVILLSLEWEGRVLSIASSYIVFGAFSIIKIRRSGYINFKYSSKVIKIILVFGIPLIPHALAGWIKFGLDRILITRFYNDSITGLYSAAVQLSMVIFFLAMAINKAYSPYLFKKLASNDNNTKILLVKITYLYMIALPLLAVLIFYFEKFIVLNFMDSSFEDLLLYLPWLLGAQVFFGMYLMFVGYIFFANKNKYLAITTIISALAHATVLFLLLPSQGPIIAAKSLFVTNFITFVIVWILGHKFYQMPWFNLKI